MEPVRCPIQNSKNAAMLLDYLDRRLDWSATIEFERHISGCAACQQTLAAQREVWNALDSWSPGPVSEDFDRRLFERIGQEERKPVWTRAWRWLTTAAMPFHFKPAMPLAAACMVIVAGFLLQAPREADLGAELKTELLEVEQVEQTLGDVEMLRDLGVDDDAGIRL